jgi:DNA-binding transcriptional LysR family regulator
MDYLLVDMRECRQLLAIAGEGSFARAARSLHMSQPALSRSIQEIERKVGFRLFERGREGAHPTDAGRMVLGHAETVIAAARDMGRELALIRGLGTGELRIGAGLFPSELFLGRAMAVFAGYGSDVRLRMLNAPAPELLKHLRKREIDLAVADPAWLEQSTDVHTIPLSSYRGHLVVRPGHPLCSRRTLRLDAVTAYPLITSTSVPPRIVRLPQAETSRQAAERATLVRWVPSLYTDSIAMMKAAVMASDAITILPSHLVQHECARKELTLLPLQLPWLQASFAVMHLSHRTLSPLAEAFIRAVVAADAEAHERTTEPRIHPPRTRGKAREIPRVATTRPRR